MKTVKYLKIQKFCLLFLLVSLLTFKCLPEDVWAKKETPLDIARKDVLSGDIRNAIIKYKSIIKDSQEWETLPEYAYALALGGYYDFALVYLDRARLLKPDNIATYYFAAQVFDLLGYEEEVVTELWPRVLEKKISKQIKWVKFDTEKLREKCKRKLIPVAPFEDPTAEFSKANFLLSQQCYFQATELFRKIITQVPNHHLPYVGYSIALEKIGALKSATQVATQARKLATLQADEAGKHHLTQRIEELERKSKTESAEELKKAKSLGITQPMAGKTTLGFAGGQIMSSNGTTTTSFNARLGTFITNKSQGGLNLGWNSGGGAGSSSSLSLGFSGSYYTDIGKPGSWYSLWGMQFAYDTSSRRLTTIYTGGLSFRFSDGTGSFDILLDLYESGTMEERTYTYNPTTMKSEKKSQSIVTLSIGFTTYFGESK